MNTLKYLILLLVIFQATSFAKVSPYQLSEHPSKWLEHNTAKEFGSNPTNISDADIITVTSALSTSKASNYILHESSILFPHKMHTWSINFQTSNTIDDEDIFGSLLGDSSSIIEFDKIGYSDKKIGLSHAIQIRRIVIGTNLAFYQFNETNVDTAILLLDDEKVNGLSLDLGMRVNIIRHPIAGKHTLAIGAYNLLSPDLKFETAQRRGLKLGFTYEGAVLDEKLSVLFQGIFDSISTAESFYTAAQDSEGDIIEGAKEIHFNFLVKAGYRINPLTSINLGIGNAFFTGGAGVNLAILRGGRDTKITYNFSKFFVDDEEYTHSLTATVAFLRDRRE